MNDYAYFLAIRFPNNLKCPDRRKKEKSHMVIFSARNYDINRKLFDSVLSNFLGVAGKFYPSNIIPIV